jgi:hypothetical protein
LSRRRIGRIGRKLRGTVVLVLLLEDQLVERDAAAYDD